MTQSAPSTRIRLLILLGFVLVLLCLPRFFRIRIETSIAKGKIEYFAERFGDVARYTDHVEWLRQPSETAQDIELYPPFVYRPLVPLLAAPLPFSARNSINVINILALLIGLYALFRLMKKLGIPDKLNLLGCTLYVVSFPTLHYGAIGFIDGALIGYLCVATWLIVAWRPRVFVPLLLIGPLLKESTIILLPVLAAEMMSRGLLKRYIWRFCALVMAYGVVYLVIRATAPVDTSYIWVPSLDRLSRNVARGRLFVSYPLTLGLPTLLLVWLLVADRMRAVKLLFRQGMSLVVGLICAYALSAYALVAAVADGRFPWTSYPFVIPIVMLLLFHHIQTRHPSRHAALHLSSEATGSQTRT